MNLTELADLYETDKGTRFKEGHNYTSVYQSFISNQEKKKMLEIGLFDGASTMMWQRFNPNLENVVIDISSENLKKQFESSFDKNRVLIELGDQSDVVFLKKIGDKYGPFDYIIDDGSHFQHHIQISFSVLFEYLNSGGFYFIEDLHIHLSKKYCRDPKESVISLFDYFIKNRDFNSYCVNNEILNRYKDQIKSVQLINNKLLVIQKV